MNKKVRIAVIGTGYMAGRHLEFLKDYDLCEVTAVCDVNPDRAKEIAEKYNCKAYSDHQQLLADKVSDAVLIVTPHFFHTSIGIDALNAGHHVLCEKPLSVHKADCERLLAAHTNKDLVFGLMFNQRTNPAYRKVKELISSGELGKINRMSWVITNWFRSDAYYAQGSWRATWAGEGGGVLLNQCPHQLDMMIWLCGMPERVRAYCRFGHYHDIEVEDDVTAYMEFPSGASGVFIANTGEAPGQNTLEICGDRGRLEIRPTSIHWSRTEHGVEDLTRNDPNPMPEPDTWEIDFTFEDEGRQHHEIMENFCEAILNGTELIAPSTEGTASVELCNAMLLSAWTEKMIEIPMDSAEYEAQLKEKMAGSRFHDKKA